MKPIGITRNKIYVCAHKLLVFFVFFLSINSIIWIYIKIRFTRVVAKQHYQALQYSRTWVDELTWLSFFRYIFPLSLHATKNHGSNARWFCTDEFLIPLSTFTLQTRPKIMQCSFKTLIFQAISSYWEFAGGGCPPLLTFLIKINKLTSFPLFSHSHSLF